MATTPLLTLLVLLPLVGGSSTAPACTERAFSIPAYRPEPAAGAAPAEVSSRAERAQPPEEGPTPEPEEPIEPPELEDPELEPDDPGIPTPDPRAPCCFTNPRYAGVCVVRPAEDETCGSILAYLNDDLSVGKTYCNNTDVRGGWEWVLCE